MILASGVGFAQVADQTPDEVSLCGTFTFQSGWSYTYLQCLEPISGGSPQWQFFAWRPQAGTDDYQVMRRPYNSTCATGILTTNNLDSGDIATYESTFLSNVSAGCQVPELLEEEPPPEPEGDNVWECEGPFCWRWGDEDDDFEIETTCDDADHREHADVAGFDQAYEDCQAANAGDEPHDPPPPDDPEVVCTGADGVACENTQQDNRELLREIRDLLNRQENPEDPPDPEPEPDVEEPPIVFTYPDLEDPVDGMPLPSEDADWMGDLTDRIDAAVTTLETTASGKFPFALGGWIPVLTLGGSTPCQEITITLLETTTDLGWCESPMYTFLTTVGRAASLLVIIIGFYLAAARTVAWA